MDYSTYWVGFGVVGAIVMFIFALCLCVVAGRADDASDRFWEEHDQFDEDQEIEDFIKRTGGHH